MKIALTGATGFVGSTVLDVALSEGLQVKALTRRDQPPRDNVEWIGGSLSDEAALGRLAEGVAALVHVAGVVNAPDRAGFEAGNVAGTAAVLAAAADAGVDRFVHVSSLAAREPRLSAYGETKSVAEQIVSESKLAWAIVRPPAIYGPRDTEMLELFRAAKTGFVPLPPRGRTSLIHVRDLARLLVALARGGSGHTLYEVDDGQDQGWSHEEMARAIGGAMGRAVTPVHLPRIVLRAAATLDRLARGPKAKLTPDRVGYMTHPDWVAQPLLAPPASLWSPRVNTITGLAETARWYRAQGWL